MSDATTRAYLAQLAAMLREAANCKLVYVASPWRSTTAYEEERNLVYAKIASASVIAAGCIPVTPHLLYTRFLDDDVPEERQAGITAGFALLARCDELWVFAKHGISAGMRGEVEFATAHDIPVRYLNMGEEDR